MSDRQSGQSVLQTVFLVSLTMLAFGSNSILARMALETTTIDPASYTTIRIVSGALMLLVLVSLRKEVKKDQSPNIVLCVLGLFGYAALFSFAYLTLETGMGALILFSCVQATMIGWGVYRGERPTRRAWLGIILAMSGFVYLLLPGLSAPDPLGAFLMALSGVAWGIYSLKGRSFTDPLAATTRNFAWSIPPSIVLSLVFFASFSVDFAGIVLAIVSGAITSALGYALWYHVLKQLTASNAAIVQLTVPLIGVIGGYLFLSEPLTLSFLIATVLILGGIALSILSPSKRT